MVHAIVAASMASSVPASASSDSLASSTNSHNNNININNKESRFNRLIHKLHGGSSSRDLTHENMATPMRYAPRSAATSPSASTSDHDDDDDDDLVLERPVFESKFMRELVSPVAASSSSNNGITFSPRPLLAPSLSSPAAVSRSPSPRLAPRDLERARSSPSHSPVASTSSPTSSTHSSSPASSLRSKLVRVASSSSVFGNNSSHSNGGNAKFTTSTNTNNGQGFTANTSAANSPSSHSHVAHHRKAASVAVGPSPSPRSRLAASLAAATTSTSTNGPSSPLAGSSSHSLFASTKTHAHRHSEDVRQYSTSAARSSPSLGVSSHPGGQPSPPLLSASHSRSRENLFAAFSLSRKRSTDGVSVATSSSTHLPIAEDDERGQDREPQDSKNEFIRNAQADTDPTIGAGGIDNDDDELTKRNSSSSGSGSGSGHGPLSTRAPATAPLFPSVPFESATRPGLLEHRYLSLDRVPVQDGIASSAAAANNKSTPGFPRHAPSASYSSATTTTSDSVLASSVYPSTGTSGTTSSTIHTARAGLISSGLSESSRRFRSAFRLNKSRGATGGGVMQTPGGAASALSNAENAASLVATGGGTQRRAMRVPLEKQLPAEEDEDETPNANVINNEAAANAMAAGTSASVSSPKSPLLVSESDSGYAKGSPSDASSSVSPSTSLASHGNTSSTLKPVSPPTSTAEAHSRSCAGSPLSQDQQHTAQDDRSRETAQERAQLVLPMTSTNLHSRPAHPPATGPASTLAASRRPGRAAVPSSDNATSPSAEQKTEDSPENENRKQERQQPISRHARTTSTARMEDLVLVPELPQLPSSRQQQPHRPALANRPEVFTDARVPAQLHQRHASDNTLVGGHGAASAHPAAHSHSQSVALDRERFAVARDVPSAATTTDADAPAHDQQEEVLLIENDKENIAAADWYRQHGLSKARRDENGQIVEKDYLPQLVDHALKNRPALGQVRRPLQEQQPNHAAPQLHHQQHPHRPYLPEPRHQQPARGGKISSSSSNGGLGYFPSDRQVVVNDYAVPTKRSGDTPPSSTERDNQHHHHQAQNGAALPFPRHLPSHASAPNEVDYAYPQQSRAAPPPSRPPTAALPALPSLSQPAQQQQQHDPAAMMQHPQQQVASTSQRRTAGTVVVKGKTYTRMGLLGRGGSSKVFRVCDKDHNVFALKKVDLGKGADSETYQAFLNEINLLEALRGHDRIIQLVAHEVNEAKRSLIMVMEIGEIDLNALLQDRIARGLPASMNFMRYMWEQMLEAVNVIHDEGIVHTDLKPANFVLVKGALKLIDFGIAKAIPNDTTNIARDQQIGTANYMSPEALNPHNSAKNGRVMKLGRPSDVWSLGCILYQMVYGHTPFGQIKNLAAKMNAIQTPGYAINFPTHAVPTTIKGEPLPDLAVRVEDDLLAVMKACLRYEPKKRATIPELLMDPFLRREGSRTRDLDSDACSPSRGLQGVSLDLVNAIVKQTLQWSQGRQPSRGEQERFIEAVLRQANGSVR